MSKHLIEIGVDDLKLKLCIGEAGKKFFLSEIEHIKKTEDMDIILEDDDLEYAQGLHVLNMIWLTDWNRKVLLHELQHYMDTLFDELCINDESEAKAIFMSNTIEKVLTVRDKEIIGLD
jgi:hypothetical protein